jgi:hypothetical protein
MPSLVPTGSPLRLVPTSLERKAVLFFDGIRYSLHIFDLAASRLPNTLAELSHEGQDADALADKIASAMSDAWLMIDSAHRLRELLEQAPNLKKNQPELQLFLRRTVPVEALRHFFQHFRTEIETFASRGMPLWGTLSWVRPNPETGQPENFTIAPGTFFHGAALPMCTFDSVQRHFVERVLLQAGPTQIDLASLLEHVTEFTSWYTEWFRNHFPDVDHHAADLHARLGVKLVPRATSASDDSGELGI